jgi:ppGpp synthetase/RelA/SpoT-type nucleotidyltranferase
MAIQEQWPEFDIRRIQRKLNNSDKSVENCPISMEELRKIYEDYISYYPTLEKIRTEILATLNGGMTGEVHSIRCRIKKPDHLVGKIIRGVYRNPKKYQMVTVDTYKKIITDFIGVRIIILDKRDWYGVHKDLLRIYRNLPIRYVRRPADIVTNYDRYADEFEGPECASGYHAECPIAYISSEDDRRIYQDKDLKVDNSKAHYRSLHYIIRYKCVYFEIQMRTLFEEGWLEFDHRMKYPNDQYNEKKQEYIGILSNLAIAADRLISYYREEDFLGASREAEVKELSHIYYDEKPEESLEDKMRKLF